ncbi:MAG: FAD-binding oxidoreductase, partial [Kiloniellales bacterium]
RKDNTGYDLKQLFLGGEGTLGIVTAAVLKLFPRPRRTATAFVALGELEAANAVLAKLRAASGDRLEACELCPRLGLDFAIRHVAGIRDPLAGHHDWYLLVEMTSGSEGDALGETLESALGALADEGAVANAAIAASEGQARDFWRIREALVEAQKHEGGSIKHDVSVPVSAVPRFIRRATALVETMVPGIRPVPFGHLGDGNIHFNLSQPEGGDSKAFLARWDEVSEKVHDIVVELGGSISAEHGIGRMKIAENARTKAEVELEMMRKIKAALDPGNIMNPGKML